MVVKAVEVAQDVLLPTVEIHIKMDILCILFRKDPSLYLHAKRAVWSSSTEYSAICSDHFIMDCFPFRFRFELENLAVTPKSKNSSKEKRKASTNLSASPTVTNTTPTATKARAMPFPLEMLSPSEDAVCQSSPPKKVRRGYVKRETARVRIVIMVIGFITS